MDLPSCIAQVYAFADVHAVTFDILINALEEAQEGLAFLRKLIILAVSLMDYSR